ncbi:MAG: zinc-dependent metalloprotease, partial [Deltaproteobacteria bacterium]|nr:zinc-dependent metalloprotease [Deltaproteobacteria bacterium]
TECGAGEYTIRQSFKKIDPDYQYEALPFSGPLTELFGFFTTERLVYDDREGVREPRKERWINRFNLWKKSWDVIDGERVPIPYPEREIRPIVYHVNQDWPADDPDLEAAVRLAADQWNEALTASVRALGKDPGQQRVFVLCPHNPVREGDPAECGPAGTAPRMGDLRYSYFAYVPTFDNYGLLGFGPSNQDPMTGEIISGNAHVYSANNRAAHQVVEMVQLLTGQMSADSYVDGVNLTNWIEQMTGRSEPLQRSFGLDDARHFAHQVSHGAKSSYWDGQRRAITAAEERAQAALGFRAWAEPYLDLMYQRGIHNGQTATALRQQRLAALQDTDIEQMLLGEDLYLGLGHDPALPVTDDLVRQASVVRGGLGEFVLQRQRLLEEYAEQRNLDLAEMADDALIGLARDLAGRNLSPDDLYHTIRRTILQAVITHECGHTLGLSHNFGGSDDAINYFDQYWRIRAQDGTVGPRLTDPITQNELDQQIYSYAYTSIMDYASRYTIDGGGIGKYDRAAIMFGYAQKVEVFENTRSVPVSTFRNWWATDGDIIGFYTSGPRATHYTYFYHQMGEDMYRSGNRSLVDVSELDDTMAQSNDGRVRVPYIYCSHTRSDLSDNCLSRDAGADSYERMKNILDDLNSWYIMRNFPRGQVGRSDDNFVERYYPRVYHRLKKWHDIYGLYLDFLPMYYTPAQVEAFLTDVESGWGTKTVAVQNAFNHLVQTLLMPDVGPHYGLVTQPDGTRVAQKYGASTGFTVDITGGRYYSTSWSGSSYDCGYYWWECLHHIGFYLDKIMAIEALSDSSTNFVARSTPEDVREWEISYYNSFAPQIAQINRAILAGRWDAIAPYWEGGQVKFPNYAGDLAQTHVTPVDPMATFTVQLYWQVLGLTRFVDNFDPRFVDQSRIYYLGEGHDTAIPASRRVVFTDPTSGLSFTAVRYDTGGGEPGAGQASLERANALLA